jgi:competence protein ComEC
MQGPKKSRRWGGGAAVLASLILIGLTVGLPEEHGCGGPLAEDQLEDDLTATCSSKAPMRVRFYMIEQGLSALVELPDGRRILVDAGASSTAPGCGNAACKNAHDNLVANLHRDLAGKPIDLMWITHQHEDHIGGAADLLSKFTVKSYVDNGRAAAAADVAAAHTAAQAAHVPISTVSPVQSTMPVKSTKGIRIRPMVPTSWVKTCDSDENICSIGLRIDYCSSSVLFTGDAEFQEEKQLDPMGPATLLQLGHHGSDTSTGPAFLAKIAPKIAVISAGRPGFGMNRSYCHPRASTVKAVTQFLGGPGSKTLLAFDGNVSCMGSGPTNWLSIPASDQLYATERDGDLSFVTHGDGVFTRE